MDNIEIEPIGMVRSAMKHVDDLPIPGQPAEVEVFPEYREGLSRIEENSHLWLLMWFHQADRDGLLTVPRRINPDLPEYGVFGMRSPRRPNPIALTLVRLEAVEGNTLRVSGLDAIDGTPVLDIKPYFENDIVFSPLTPYIRAVDRSMRQNSFFKRALSHHQEVCPDLYLAVRMALLADELMGQLNTADLKLAVYGSPCLADALQGLSRARLSNPPRFSFQERTECACSVWKRDERCLTLTARQQLDLKSYQDLTDEEIFIVELKA